MASVVVGSHQAWPTELPKSTAFHPKLVVLDFNFCIHTTSLLALPGTHSLIKLSLCPVDINTARTKKGISVDKPSAPGSTHRTGRWTRNSTQFLNHIQTTVYILGTGEQCVTTMTSLQAQEVVQPGAPAPNMVLDIFRGMHSAMQ